MSNNILELDSITPDKFLYIQKNIGNQLGTSLVGSAGKVEEYGVGVSWNYDATTQKLILVNFKKPFFVSQETVIDKLKEACT